MIESASDRLAAHYAAAGVDACIGYVRSKLRIVATEEARSWIGGAVNDLGAARDLLVMEALESSCPLKADLSTPTVEQTRAQAFEEAANIAEAIDSGRGNESEIAQAIRRRVASPSPISDERLRKALEGVVGAIGEWSRPTGANGMIPAGEDHPLCVAARSAREALSASPAPASDKLEGEAPASVATALENLLSAMSSLKVAGIPLSSLDMTLARRVTEAVQVLAALSTDKRGDGK